MAVSKNNIKKTSLAEFVKNHEYEIILFVFLLSRFIFKNILGLAKYFTDQPIFGLSDTLNIAIGATVAFFVCICLASILGQLIRKNGKDFENASLILVALFFACPATLPFLFDTYYMSGTQMLYPFALFVFTVYLIGRPVVKWLVPVICAIYFIPSLFTSERFFTVLRKEAILYVPLILLFLFLDMMKNTAIGNKYEEFEKDKVASTRKNTSESNTAMFVRSSLVSVGSFVFTLIRGEFNFESLYSIHQRIDVHLIVCLLLTSPLLLVFGAVLFQAYKYKFSKLVIIVFLFSIILISPLFRNNYYGLWIPFILMSVLLLVFACIGQKNRAMLSAAQHIGEFFLKRKLLLFFILIAMASLSNTSMVYGSYFLTKIFSYVPY